MKERGLPTSGRKAELAARLLLHLQTSLDRDAKVEEDVLGIGTDVSLALPSQVIAPPTPLE